MPLGFEPALRKLQMNPKGIPPQSPGLRAERYPGLSDFILSGWSAAENVQTPPADGSRRTLAGADGLAPAAGTATKAACAIRSVFAGRAAQECENRNPKSEPRTSNEGANGIYWNHASRITHHASLGRHGCDFLCVLSLWLMPSGYPTDLAAEKAKIAKRSEFWSDVDRARAQWK